MSPPIPDRQAAQKRAVGEAAARLIEDGMTVGLGTGSTAAFFVSALGRRVREEGLVLRCVATSRATEILAGEAGLTVLELDAVSGAQAGIGRPIDLTVDGADEVAPDLSLIKGGGAALLREKLVWTASRRCVGIADAGKRVERLGAFPLPVEVVAFGHLSTADRIAHALEELGFAGKPVLRLRDGGPVVSDNGGRIYDLPLGRIDDPAGLGATLKAITGVVEHGLFIGLAAEVLVAGDDGVHRLAPAGAAA